MPQRSESLTVLQREAEVWGGYDIGSELVLLSDVAGRRSKQGQKGIKG